MTNARKRKFKSGQTIYVVDYAKTSKGLEAVETKAEISQVNAKNKTLDAVLYGDTCQRYSFEDYGRLIFDSANEAIAAAKSIPVPGAKIYQRINKRVYKKEVLAILGQYSGGVFDIVMRLNTVKIISTKEIGKSIFLSETEARENKN